MFRYLRISGASLLLMLACSLAMGQATYVPPPMTDPTNQAYTYNVYNPMLPRFAAVSGTTGTCSSSSTTFTDTNANFSTKIGVGQTSWIIIQDTANDDAL